MDDMMDDGHMMVYEEKVMACYISIVFHGSHQTIFRHKWGDVSPTW